MKEHSSKIKALSSKAQPVSGMTYDVQMKLGDWAEWLSLMIITLDDFDIILGNDFFVKAKVALMPHLGRVLISDRNKPCFVPALSDDKHRGKKEMVSTLQLGKSLRKGQQTYFAAKKVGHRG